jgi:hypothetical protein
MAQTLFMMKIKTKTHAENTLTRMLKFKLKTKN